MANQGPRHLLHVFPTFAVGGSQMRFAQLMRLHGLRYKNTIIAMDGDCTMAERLPGGIEAAYVANPSRTTSPVAGTVNALRALNQIAPDVLVTYNWGSMDWSLAKRFRPRLRHIHIEDGFGPEERVRQLGRRVWTRRLVLRESQTTVVVPSKRLEKIALDVWRLPQQQVRYIPNGIDCTRFAAGPRERNPNEIVIGTVASLRPEKNLTRLIDLFCQAQQRRPAARMKLVVVGDGSERQALQRHAAGSACGDRIAFAGATSSPEDYLAAMHIFALTSDTEQMPLSVLEAMATGLPVVSFDVGDLSSMVAAENVPLVSTPLADSGSYVEMLLRLVDNADLRTRLGAANRKIAETRFDERTMAAAYGELFG